MFLKDCKKDMDAKALRLTRNEDTDSDSSDETVSPVKKNPGIIEHVVQSTTESFIIYSR